MFLQIHHILQTILCQYFHHNWGKCRPDRCNFPITQVPMRTILMSHLNTFRFDSIWRQFLFNSLCELIPGEHFDYKALGGWVLWLNRTVLLLTGVQNQVILLIDPFRAVLHVTFNPIFRSTSAADACNWKSSLLPVRSEKEVNFPHLGSYLNVADCGLQLFERYWNLNCKPFDCRLVAGTRHLLWHIRWESGECWKRFAGWECFRRCHLPTDGISSHIPVQNRPRFSIE